MAKKKSQRLTTSKATPQFGNQVLEGLARFVPFLIISTTNTSRPTKIWFIKNKDGAVQSRYENVSILKGKNSSRWLVDENCKLPVKVQEELCRAYITWARKQNRSKSSLDSAYYVMLHFLDFLETQRRVNKLSDITSLEIFEYFKDIRGNRDRTKLFDVLIEHPSISDAITLIKGNRFGSSNRHVFKSKKVAKVEDLFKNNALSDKVSFQVISFTLYNIEFMKIRLKWLEEADESQLAKQGLLIGEADTKNLAFIAEDTPLKRICDLFHVSSEAALEALFNNFLIFARGSKICGVILPCFDLHILDEFDNDLRQMPYLISSEDYSLHPNEHVHSEQTSLHRYA